MEDSGLYDILQVNIRVKVFYDSKFDCFIGNGTVNEVLMGTDGNIHIDTVMLDSGKLINRAGLTIVPMDA